VADLERSAIRKVIRAILVGGLAGFAVGLIGYGTKALVEGVTTPTNIILTLSGGILAVVLLLWARRKKKEQDELST